MLLPSISRLGFPKELEAEWLADKAQVVYGACE